MKNIRRLFHVCLLGLLSQTPSAIAADSYWTAGNGNFTNAANWNGGIPGPADNAHFTNNASYQVDLSTTQTNANGVFNASSGTVIINPLLGRTWVVTNSIVIGTNAGASATVQILQNNILLTNADGTASLIVGGAGVGDFHLNGTMSVDRIIATNGLFRANYSTLNILHGSTIVRGGGADYTIGGLGGTTFWNVLGGTNSISVGAANSIFGANAGFAHITVNGPDTVFTNNRTFMLAIGGSNNTFVATNGAKVYMNRFIVGSSQNPNQGKNNEAVITGNGTVFENFGYIRVSDSQANSNRLIIADGARVHSVGDTVFVDAGLVGGNLLRVTGAGTRLETDNNAVNVRANPGNRFFVEDGAHVEMGEFQVDNTVVITGPGSATTNRFDLIMSTSTLGNITVSNGGALVSIGAARVGDIVGSSGDINVTGAGSLLRVRGALSIGSNTLTKGTGSVTIQNGATLEATNRVAVGFGGSLTFSNTSTSVAGVLTNQGIVRVLESSVHFSNQVVNSGRFISDPSTSTFHSNVTVTASGTLEGGAGDVFDFKKSLLIQSTNNAQFNLLASTVSFSGGGVHTNLITGEDFGTNAPYSGNFEYGRLTLGSTNDTVCFGCGNVPPVASNALYVGWLDLVGFTNQFASVSNMVVSLLHAPTNVNLYYLNSDIESGNAWLGNQTFQLTACDGVTPGGFLMAAIPEPGTLAFVIAGISMLLRFRCSRGR